MCVVRKSQLVGMGSPFAKWASGIELRPCVLVSLAPAYVFFFFLKRDLLELCFELSSLWLLGVLV